MIFILEKERWHREITGMARGGWVGVGRNVDKAIGEATRIST